MLFTGEIDAADAQLFIGEEGGTTRKVDWPRAKISVLVKQDGLVEVEAPSGDIAKNVVNWVIANAGCEQLEEGAVFQGLVTSKSQFGDFVALAPDIEGLLLVSDVEDGRCFFPGDLIQVKIAEKDYQERLRLCLAVF